MEVDSPLNVTHTLPPKLPESKEHSLPYASYRKPLKRNNVPLTARKVPSKQAKEESTPDMETHVPGTSNAIGFASQPVKYNYKKDLTRIASGIGRNTNKKPFGKVVVPPERQDISQLSPNERPQNEESLSDWIKPRTTQNTSVADVPAKVVFTPKIGFVRESKDQQITKTVVTFPADVKKAEQIAVEPPFIPEIHKPDFQENQESNNNYRGNMRNSTRNDVNFSQNQYADGFRGKITGPYNDFDARIVESNIQTPPSEKKDWFKPQSSHDDTYANNCDRNNRGRTNDRNNDNRNNYDHRNNYDRRNSYDHRNNHDRRNSYDHRIDYDSQRSFDRSKYEHNNFDRPYAQNGNNFNMSHSYNDWQNNNPRNNTWDNNNDKCSEENQQNWKQKLIQTQFEQSWNSGSSGLYAGSAELPGKKQENKQKESEEIIIGQHFNMSTNNLQPVASAPHVNVPQNFPPFQTIPGFPTQPPNFNVFPPTMANFPTFQQFQQQAWNNTCQNQSVHVQSSTFANANPAQPILTPPKAPETDPSLAENPLITNSTPIQNTQYPGPTQTTNMIPGAVMSSATHVTGQTQAFLTAEQQKQIEDYQKQWQEYQVKMEKYQKDMVEYNKQVSAMQSNVTAQVLPQQFQSIGAPVQFPNFAAGWPTVQALPASVAPVLPAQIPGAPASSMPVVGIPVVMQASP